MTATGLRAVIFDYGGVLTTPIGESIRAWLEADGIKPETFTKVLKEWLGRYADSGTPIHRLELGELSVKEFDRLLAARLETYDGSPVDPEGVLSRLFAGMRPNPEMFALAEELRDAGIRLALLSNSWGNFYPRKQVDALFEVVVISEEVAMRKPEPPIFDRTLNRLGLSAEECLFIDDAEPNVLGARAVGLGALLHTDPASTRAALTRMIPTLGGAA